MSAKRIVFIIMCVLLAAMVIMFAVVGSRFTPVLQVLMGASGQTEATDGTAPTPGATTTVPGTGEPAGTTVPDDTEPSGTTEPGHEHEYVLSRVEEAGCDTYGYSIYTCACGKTDMRDLTEPTDHVYGTGIKVTNCEEQGYTEFICVKCGYSDKRNYTDPVGHDYRLVESMAVTCTEDGYDLYRCSRCQDERKENEVKASGHTDFEWIQMVAPGPNEPGEEMRTCSTCGETETQPCQLRIRSRASSKNATLHSYTVYVGTTNTPMAILYVINDYSCAEDMTIEYTEDGLVVSYTDKSGLLQATALAPLQNVTLNIDADGKIVAGGQPQPSEPTTPPSEPSGEAQQ